MSKHFGGNAACLGVGSHVSLVVGGLDEGGTLHGSLDDVGHGQERATVFTEGSVDHFVGRIEDTSHVTALIERLVGQCQALEFPHVGLKKLEGPAEKVEPRAVEVQPLRERKGILNGQSHVGHAQLGLYGAVGILHRAVNNALWMDKNLYLIGRNAK